MLLCDYYAANFHTPQNFIEGSICPARKVVSKAVLEGKLND
jgi:hypothetical protein